MRRWLTCTLLCALLALSACGRPPAEASGPPAATQSPTAATMPPTTAATEPEPAEPEAELEAYHHWRAVNQAAQWQVAPRLAYDRVYRCAVSGRFVTWVEGTGEIMLDAQTGAMTNEPCAHGGPGLYALFYDPVQDAYGYDNGYEHVPIAAGEITDSPYFGSGFVPVAQATLVEAEGSVWWEVAEEGRWAMLYDGVYITGFDFDHALSHDNRRDQQFAYVGQGGLYAMLGPGGDMLSGYLFEALEAHPSGLVAARRDGAWGFVTPGGQTVIPFIYEDAVSVDARTAFVKVDGRYGILDKPATADAWLPGYSILGLEGPVRLFCGIPVPERDTLLSAVGGYDEAAAMDDPALAPLWARYDREYALYTAEGYQGLHPGEPQWHGLDYGFDVPLAEGVYLAVESGHSVSLADIAQSDPAGLPPAALQETLAALDLLGGRATQWLEADLDSDGRGEHIITLCGDAAYWRAVVLLDSDWSLTACLELLDEPAEWVEGFLGQSFWDEYCSQGFLGQGILADTDGDGVFEIYMTHPCYEGRLYTISTYAAGSFSGPAVYPATTMP